MSNFTDCLGNADYKSEIYYVTYKIKKQISLTIQNISKDIGNGYSSVLLVGVEIGITFLKNNFVKGRKVKNTLASTQQFLFYVVAVQSLSRVQLFGISWTIAPQSPLSMGFPRKEYQNGLPFPSPGDLPNPWMKSMSPILAGRFFTTEPLGKTS